MDRLASRKYQLSQLALLKQFDIICKDHGWTYYLVFGTLLGAVRHYGFIPWDADIDIAMYRKDYEAVRKWFGNQPVSDLFYEHYDTEKHHFSPHAVLRIKGTHIIYNVERSSRYTLTHDGIYIDIFPIDFVTENETKQQKQVKAIWRTKRIVELKAAPTYGNQTSSIKRIGKSIVSLLLSPISFKMLNEHADHVMQTYDDHERNKVAILTDPHVFKKQLYPREVFGTPSILEFEGEKFMAPSDPNKFLEIRYGDYMKLPPESDRWGYLENTIREIDYGKTTLLAGLDE